MSLTVPYAIELCQKLSALGLKWMEEVNASPSPLSLAYEFETVSPLDFSTVLILYALRPVPAAG